MVLFDRAGVLEIAWGHLRALVKQGIDGEDAVKVLRHLLQLVGFFRLGATLVMRVDFFEPQAIEFGEKLASGAFPSPFAWGAFARQIEISIAQLPRSDITQEHNGLASSAPGCCTLRASKTDQHACRVGVSLAPQGDQDFGQGALVFDPHGVVGAFDATKRQAPIRPLLYLERWVRAGFDEPGDAGIPQGF